MRQDQTRPVTPPPVERDANRKEERSATQKTPSQVRANRPTWSNIERNHFFDALNEFGKDFEAIGNFINTKLKRRSPTVDISFKTKDQVRQHYYQTYHKICKYMRFSEGKFKRLWLICLNKLSLMQIYVKYSFLIGTICFVTSY